MKRTAWLGSVAGLLIGSVVLADPAVVRTRDGATYEGEMTEAADAVTVSIRGVDTVIPRTDIVSIEQLGNYEQDYRARLQKLEARDTAGRIAMAREAFDRRRYDLARGTLQEALTNDPNSREAAELLETVDSQVRMERSRSTPAAAPAAVSPTAPSPYADRRLLTPADIEAIRRKEIKLSDASVRLRFEGDVKKRFADSQNVPFPDFNMLSPLEQALHILDKGDDTLRANVRIMTDPESILVYRRQVQPLVVQSCATTGCHGPNAGGGFMLFTGAENDLVTYTNFYILQSYQRPAESPRGVFGQRVQKLINRRAGDQSLLANYGLPPTIGEYDHPLVRGRPIQPIFRNREDARYQMVVEWMDQILSPFEPDYGIRYTPPMPTTAPAPEAP